MKYLRWIGQIFEMLFRIKKNHSDRQESNRSIDLRLLKINSKRLKKVKYKTKKVVVLPEEDMIEFKTVYIVGENGCVWLAALRCPCDCKDIIQLNLLKEATPCWRISYKKKNKVTITPSIRRIVGCNSHFTLTKGKITFWGVYNTFYPQQMLILLILL